MLHLLAAGAGSVAEGCCDSGMLPCELGTLTKLPMLVLSDRQPLEMFVLMALAVAAICRWMQSAQHHFIKQLG